MPASTAWMAGGTPGKRVAQSILPSGGLGGRLLFGDEVPEPVQESSHHKSGMMWNQQRNSGFSQDPVPFGQ